MDKTEILRIENARWKCVAVLPRYDYTEEWRWREKYIGLMGNIYICQKPFQTTGEDAKYCVTLYRITFIDQNGRGFVANLDDFMLVNRLTLITDNSFYIFEEVTGDETQNA